VELPAIRDLLAANHLARTPPMGWNSWNGFHTDISDAAVRGVADALVASGMRDAGYLYINIDDGWQGQRDANGVLQANPHFPDMKALADYVHSKGLKLGIYSSPGPRTCGGYEGSYGHEELDARTWAAWGIDYLKYDWCTASRVWTNAEMRAVYQKMGEALQQTGREIIYSLCQYGLAEVEDWGPLVGGNLWRTTGDIFDNWNSMLGNVNQQDNRAAKAGPGRWNDPDMLEVGNGGMTATEYRTHFSLWAVVAATLIAGNDPRNMDEDTRSILLNREVIAVNQDALGAQGRRVGKQGEVSIWLRPLAGNAYALALVNEGVQETSASVNWADLQLPANLRARELWSRQDIGVLASGFDGRIPSHGVVLLKLQR
jgi:alpha-galactosidase